MRRRELIGLIGGAVVAWPLAAGAQQPDRVRRLGVLMDTSESDLESQVRIAAFRQGIENLGDGNNLRIELRWGAADPDRIKAFAKELVDLRPDAILGVTTPVISALARETQTIPIVFVIVADPIGGGFAANLAHPGGNVTGFAAIDTAIGGKWVALLKEIAPRTEHVVLLFNPATAAPIQSFMASIQAAASSLAVQASAAPVQAKDEIEGVIAAQARNPGGGLIVMPDPFNRRNRDLIITLAARYGVPAIYYDHVWAKLGSLIAYSDDYNEHFRQAAGYIDRILKGTKPADLPIQLPTKFKLAINLRTAKALGLNVPPGLLAVADEVTE